jgi:hypothetical protein
MVALTFSAGNRLTGAQLQALVDQINLNTAALDDLEAPPLVIVRTVVAQSVATGGAGVDLIFDTEDYDVDGMFSGAPSNTVTIQTAGKYQASAFVSLGGSGQFYQISHNGTARASHPAAATANLITPVFSAVATDVIRVGLFQSSGAPQNATGTLSVRRVSD